MLFSLNGEFVYETSCRGTDLGLFPFYPAISLEQRVVFHQAYQRTSFDSSFLMFAKRSTRSTTTFEHERFNDEFAIPVGYTSLHDMLPSVNSVIAMAI
jgi:hypothetical protein